VFSFRKVTPLSPLYAIMEAESPTAGSCNIKLDDRLTLCYTCHMVTTKPCRLVAYFRVSTAKQGVSGLGIDAQKAAIAAHVAKTGCKLVGSYTEVESGRKSDRTELGRAIAHAKRAKATLVIAKMDRLSRNLHFITGLQESRVPFVACDNPHANTLTVHILAAVAQEEARAISERTKAALAAAKARGKQLGTNNLTREGTLKGVASSVAVRRERKAEAYAHILPTILECKAQGVSLHEIAKRLNAAGEETRSGKNWNPVQVSRVLKSVEQNNIDHLDAAKDDSLKRIGSWIVPPRQDLSQYSKHMARFYAQVVEDKALINVVLSKAQSRMTFRYLLARGAS
jgi:DNA invertase Pin-like site-specific DNA recombinase